MEPVPGGLDLPPAESAQLFAHHAVVSIEHGAPSPVAEGSQVLGRRDDVGEQHRREHPLDLDDRTLASQELSDLVDNRRISDLIKPDPDAR